MQRHTTADGLEPPAWSASNGGGRQERADSPATETYQHCWPAQAYHCTFCARVFRTAQALGGHMNIHKRERATLAIDAGAHFYTRRRDSRASNSMLSSRSSSHPVATLDQLRGPLFRSTPPSPFPAHGKDNCYANGRIAVAHDSAAHAVTTANFSRQVAGGSTSHHRVGWNGGDSPTHLMTTANFFAPIQVERDATCRHRVGWNGGDSATHPVTTANFFAPIQFQEDATYGHHVGWNGGGRDAARLEESVGHNASNPLSWLFSELRPPNSISKLSRQQLHPQQNHEQFQWRGGGTPTPLQQNRHEGNILAQQQQQQWCGGSALTQKNFARRYQHVVAVRPSARHRSVAPPFFAHSHHARGRLEGGAHRSGEYKDGGLDLELRL